MGGMMFLLLWVYIAGVIIIGGGCLCAALAHLRGHAYVNHSQIGARTTGDRESPVDHPEP